MMASFDTFVISFLVTGRVGIAGSIAGIEMLTKIAFYYLHERIWAAVRWGRRLGRSFKPGAVPLMR